MEIDRAIQVCPFLHNVSLRQGHEYARCIAINPLRPAQPSVRRPILEESDDFNATFRLFHGPSSPVPLAAAKEPGLRALSAHCSSTSTSANVSECPAKSRSAAALLASAPMASMSLSHFGGLPDFGMIFRRFQQGQNGESQPSLRKSNARPEPKPNVNRASPAGPQQLSNSSSVQPSGSGGTCPMRKFLGPFAGVVFNSAGHLQCPAPIIQARAALAATKPIRELRPQALPIKLAAVIAMTGFLNVPCGMWREHTAKFSFEWIVAVHATIPFVAMIRKAVLMPKFAILFTVASAIAGQAAGARLERERMAWARLQEAAKAEAKAEVKVEVAQPAKVSRLARITKRAGRGAHSQQLAAVNSNITAPPAIAAC